VSEDRGSRAAAPEAETSDGSEAYSEVLLSHFKEPRNSGRLPYPDATGRAENPASGATLELQVALHEGRIQEARFKAEGCAATIAAGSVVTELLSGRTPEDAMTLQRIEVDDALGGLPPTRKHASALAVDAVRATLDDLRRRSAG
jgi:nitrogen fixation NifU-like protein